MHMKSEEMNTLLCKEGEAETENNVDIFSIG